MKMTPRMVVLVMLAFGTLIVLSLSVLGAQFVANQYAAKRDNPTASPTSSPMATVDPASDEDIIAIYSSRFVAARLANGGTEPIIFVTIDTDDATALAPKVNESLGALRELGGIESVTLLFTYNGQNYNTSELSELIDNSESIENQLIVQLA